MGIEPTETGGLSADARAIIGVVLDAVDIPHAATNGHEETRGKILTDRLLCTVVTLRRLAEQGRADELAGDIEYLRECLAEHPAAGYVTSEQAHERIAAGATWREAVALDYRAPAVDEPDAHDQDDEGEVSATVPGSWPGGELAAVRAAADGVEPDERHVQAVSDVVYLSGRGPVFRRLADTMRADGQPDVATALDAAADAHERVAAVLDAGGDVLPVMEDVYLTTVAAKRVIDAARAAEVPPVVAEGTPSSGGYLIPPPSDPALRAEWQAGVAARDAAGLSGFVGEDYPTDQDADGRAVLRAARRAGRVHGPDAERVALRTLRAIREDRLTGDEANDLARMLGGGDWRAVDARLDDVDGGRS